MISSKNPLLDWLNRFRAYKKEIILTTVVALSAVGGTVGYLSYRRSREAAAHRAWVALREYVDATVGTANTMPTRFTQKVFATEQEKWQAVAEVSQRAYNKHKGTGLAPFFLVQEAEAQRRLGALPRALKTLEQAIGSVRNAEMKEAYQIKQALMRLDSPETGDVTAGLTFLKERALRDNSLLHDYVLYQLGSYYWDQKNVDEVRNYWKMLTLKYSKASPSPSPWAHVVQERLNLIESD